MSTDKVPAIQFYTSDWLSDPGVRMLTYEERGVWLEMLCYMNKSPERGCLVFHGKPMANANVIAMLLLSQENGTRILERLESLEIFTRREDGAIMSRRMVRDEAKRSEVSRKRAKAGRTGGKARWNDRKQVPEVCHDYEMAKHGSSSSSSSSTSEKKEIGLRPTKKSRKANAYSDDFEAWWRSYPSRPGCPKGNKAEASKAWNALSSEQRAKLPRATANLIASDTIPKDAERFLRPPRGASDGEPPFEAWCEIEQRAASKPRKGDQGTYPSDVIARLEQDFN